MILDIRTIKYKDMVVFEKVLMKANFKRISKFLQDDKVCLNGILNYNLNF